MASRKWNSKAHGRPEAFSAIKHILAGYRYRAANKAIPFTLDFLEFKELIQRDCIYCGSSPDNLYKGARGYRMPYQGLDRLNNSEGYTLENVVPCCEKCNAIKSDLLTPREMLAAIKAIKKLRD